MTEKVLFWYIFKIYQKNLRQCTLTDRMDKLESEVETRLTQRLGDKLAQLVDKRMNIKLKKPNTKVEDRVETTS